MPPIMPQDMFAVTSKLAVQMAEILAQNGIPSVLLCWVAVDLYGDMKSYRVRVHLGLHAFDLFCKSQSVRFYRVSQDVEFVIPDSHISMAMEALEDAGHDLCFNDFCAGFYLDRKYADVQSERMHSMHLIPAAHFHYVKGRAVSSLVRQSEALPWLLDIPVPSSPPTRPEFMLSSDDRLPPRRGHGRSSAVAVGFVYKDPIPPLGIWFTSVHQPTFCLFYALDDFCLYPEYLDGVSEEARILLDGGSGINGESTITNNKRDIDVSGLLDAFPKESTHLNPRDTI
ncbi:hypothetical protein BDW69DRAFT_182658 [Aspergillus filifer]